MRFCLALNFWALIGANLCKMIRYFSLKNKKIWQARLYQKNLGNEKGDTFLKIMKIDLR